ncbi:hypothetical protein B5X24_HaOG202300 [Helicoverpa armigera]|uniref:Uncharacterized protein n=1 Tax=Helicoverpa armigera TaxID=29058 RepID=A0A2W1BXB8_HELAM|nr:hypothetical protein B5X24_HaOG202300 [Helicoverpa armigera]
MIPTRLLSSEVWTRHVVPAGTLLGLDGGRIYWKTRNIPFVYGMEVNIAWSQLPRDRYRFNSVGTHGRKCT